MRALINGIQMNFASDGEQSAPAVILHHPLACDLGFWDATVRALAADYRVVRFDARGHGQSDAPAGPYDFATLADDVIALMDHLGIGVAQFVGLSMGGMVGQMLGLAHPDRFSSLTIASAGPRTPEPMRAAWLARITAVQDGGMASQIDGSIPRWLTAATRSERPDLVARCTASIARTKVAGYAGWCAAIAQFDALDRLGAITLPVAVIAGSDDQAVPFAAVEAMVRALPNATLSVIPDAAHFSVLEAPDAFHAALLPFLTAHAQRP